MPCPCLGQALALSCSWASSCSSSSWCSFFRWCLTFLSFVSFLSLSHSLFLPRHHHLFSFASSFFITSPPNLFIVLPSSSSTTITTTTTNSPFFAQITSLLYCFDASFLPLELLRPYHSTTIPQNTQTRGSQHQRPRLVFNNILILTRTDLTPIFST